MNSSTITDPRIRFFFILQITLILFLLSACADKNKFNVVIVSFDTTRADHIGTYGKLGAQTPTIDALAGNGVVYEKSLAPVPITLPSHSTIMTGKVPFTHGVRDNGLFVLNSENLTLAEILKQNGYKTAAAIGSFPLTSQFGINQGFDYFNEHITQKQEDMYGDKTIPKDALFFDERTSTQVNQAIMPWIEENHKSPFFVWLHYFDPHHPHEPPTPYDQEFAHDLYQGEIAFSDENLGKIIEQLKRLNVYDNSIIVFTSDHGEGNDEHNESTHSMLIYNTTLHVPLVIKYPNQKFANRRIKSQVASVDILPTILSVLNIQIPDNIQGSLLPVNESTVDSNREIYIETLSPKLARGWGEQRGLVRDGYKYIFGPKKELYNLELDPNEVDNVIDVEPEKAKKMKGYLEEYIQENMLSSSVSSTVNMSEKTKNILKGLGYIQSSGSGLNQIVEKLDDSGDAPQSHVSSISSHSVVKHKLFKGDYTGAIRYIDSLLTSDPGNIEFIELKIQANLMLGNFIQAKKLLESFPDTSYGTLTPHKKLSSLARVNLLLGNQKTAKQLYKESEEIEMTISGQYKLSQIFAHEKKLTQQQIHLINLLKLDKENIRALNDLAINYALSGEFAIAEESFIKAITINPLNPGSFYNYGVYLNSVADYQSAIVQLEKAMELDYKENNLYYALIEIYLKLGKTNKANKTYQLLSKLAPNSVHFKKAKKLIESQENES